MKENGIPLGLPWAGEPNVWGGAYRDPDADRPRSPEALEWEESEDRTLAQRGRWVYQPEESEINPQPEVVEEVPEQLELVAPGAPLAI
ncbi:unnamed protein product [Sphagnum tenellum]